MVSIQLVPIESFQSVDGYKTCLKMYCLLLLDCKLQQAEHYQSNTSMPILKLTSSQASKLRYFKDLCHRLTWVKFRASSVAKKL